MTSARRSLYTTHLGFRLLPSTPPAFADVERGDLRLLLSGRTSSAGRPMPDGRQPEPGGWNRKLPWEQQTFVSGMRLAFLLVPADRPPTQDAGPSAA